MHQNKMKLLKNLNVHISPKSIPRIAQILTISMKYSHLLIDMGISFFVFEVTYKWLSGNL